MKAMSSLAVLVLSLSSQLGCNSTGVGNPGAEMSVTVVNDLTAEPQAADPTVQLPPTQMHHVLLAFSELRFLPCDAEVGNVTVPGPFVVDLVTGKTKPAIPSVPVAPGGFCGLDAPLTTAAPVASLLGRSILFSGTRADGALFILYAAMPGTVHMRPSSGIIWDASTASSMIWALRPQRWLAPAELDAEPSDPLGSARRVIVIDVNRHPLLFTAIRNRIGSRSTIYFDRNKDGQLDGNERIDDVIGEGLPSLD